MTSSKAAVFVGPEEPIQLRDVGIPSPVDGEVLVRVLGCTLCGSDLHSKLGRRTVPMPTVLGHEIVGEIQQFGSNATKQDMRGKPLGIGDRVTWCIVANCGECFYCQNDLPQKCTNSVKYGHEGPSSSTLLRGGLAEYCLLAPGTRFVRLNNEIPLAVMCPANCATATVAAAVASVDSINESHACVMGAGLLGLTTCAMLRSGGAASVVCVDLNQERLDRAREFGATHAISPDKLAETANSVSDGRGFDQVFEMSGSGKAISAGLDSIRIGGDLVLVGAVFPGPALPVSIEQIVRRNQRLIGIHNYRPQDLVAAVEFLERNHQNYPFEEVVSSWFELDDVVAAFESGENPRRIRVGVSVDRQHL